MMKHKNKDMMLKVFIGILTAAIIGWTVSARILQNGSGGGYEGSGDEESSTADTIENYVVEGAGHYLNAHSRIQALLGLVELQDLQGADSNGLQQNLDSALYHMNRARDTYCQLILKAEVTPYRGSVIARLKAFDYPSFMQQNGLNPVVFKEVESYLENGDITGIYRRTRARFTDIIDMLNKIKTGVDAGKMPALSTCRRLNETCAELSLFGSYTARVFQAIL